MPQKLLPSEWERIYGVKILDPDGWRVDNQSFDLPITEDEWRVRMDASTTISKEKEQVLHICRVCTHEVESVKNLELYVIGSEGLNVCHRCEMDIVHYIRTVMSHFSREKLHCHKIAKKNQKEQD